METTPGWTLEELCRRAAVVLAPVPGARPPDARVVRWYAGIGLVDRPVGGRGRGARYGLRHLRQLVAVRRLQAQGWALADIQGRLAGADDEALQSLAALPDPAVLDHEAASAAREPAPTARRSAPGPRDRFWASGPPVRLSAGAEVHARPARAPDPPGPRPGEPGEPGEPWEPWEPGAVGLADGVVLVLPRRLSSAEAGLVTDAAAPLVAVLASLGLAGPLPFAAAPRAAAPVAHDHVPPSASTSPGGSS